MYRSDRSRGLHTCRTRDLHNWFSKKKKILHFNILPFIHRGAFPGPNTKHQWFDVGRGPFSTERRIRICDEKLCYVAREEISHCLCPGWLAVVHLPDWWRVCSYRHRHSQTNKYAQLGGKERQININGQVKDHTIAVPELIAYISSLYDDREYQFLYEYCINNAHSYI